MEKARFYSKLETPISLMEKDMLIRSCSPIKFIELNHPFNANSIDIIKLHIKEQGYKPIYNKTDICFNKFLDKSTNMHYLLIYVYIILLYLIVNNTGDINASWHIIINILADYNPAPFIPGYSILFIGIITVITGLFLLKRTNNYDIPEIIF